MIPFEGKQNQPLRISQEGPVRLQQHQFWSHGVGDENEPPRLVPLVLVISDISATTVATFSFSACGRFEDIFLESFHNYCSGNRFHS